MDTNDYLMLEKCVREVNEWAKEGMSDLNLLSASYLTKLKLRLAGRKTL